FMEWLVSHSVPYPDEKYHNAYGYDIYDESINGYLPQDIVAEKINELGLIYVPVFYKGDFISWEHINSFVGKTELGGEYGEGIVVKNQTKLNNPNTKMPFYTKIVCEQFCETKAHKCSKPMNSNKLAERERLLGLVKSVVTIARVQKILHKLVDEDIISEDWNEKDMKIISQNLGREIYCDCQKEEPDIVKEVGESFGKFASSVAMKIARDILNSKR
ncbi:MAG: RNA ligase, partial [Lachnospiraceae bacterium]|nr:RNA ligase [Lachnospiraceae bacterium]